MGNKFPSSKYLTSFGKIKGDQGVVQRDFVHGNLGQEKKGVGIWNNG
jgi:hypothetical protein